MIEGANQFGNLAADFLDVIEAVDVPDGATAKVRTVAIVAEVEMDDADGEGFTRILTRCSDDRRWLQEGLLEAGRRVIEAGTEYRD